jgi:transketolase C-terminal domain/subunit
LLLVACDAEEPDSKKTSSANYFAGRPAIDLGFPLGFEYVGPIPASDSRQLIDVLAKIKQLGQPTLLHLKIRKPAGPTPEPPASDPWKLPSLREEIPPSRVLRHMISRELAQHARNDPRITAISTSIDTELLRPWEELADRMFRVESGVSYALQWCATLATGGSRPFVFLSWQELQNSFGQMRQDICLKRAGVTLIVEPDAELAGSDSFSMGLAGLRQLPHLCVLSPKDSTELRQMVGWCVTQEDPAVIWLPEAIEPQISWKQGPQVGRGLAEQLTPGRHVAIIAWGPMVAAAYQAAESLAQYGIEAAVINARFAQPLDHETIVRAVRGSLCAVLVDDADEQGGFSSWVLNDLLYSGITQPVSIVAPQARLHRHHPHDVHKQCSMRIVERCRWLADPIESPSRPRVEPTLPSEVDDGEPAEVWSGVPCLTTGDAYDEHRQVLAQQFSPFTDRWVRNYSRVGARDVYLWRWCLHGLRLTSLSCIAPELRDDLCETKLLAVMYGVMLDDVADKGGEETFLTELTKIISGAHPRDFSKFSSEQQAYARYTCDLWESFEHRLKGSPCYTDYEELLAYDHQQILNTMSYSCLVNRHPALLNVQEHDMYLPHNMQMMSFATMDLMCSPDFDRRELGRLREVIWHAQSMGRIGNLVSTWQREIADRDFTSGVFARALCEGDLTLEDLRSAPPQTIEAAIRRGGHELYFLRKWEAHRKTIQMMSPHIRSVDVDALLAALQRLIHMELSSRGFK